MSVAIQRGPFDRSARLRGAGSGATLTGRCTTWEQPPESLGADRGPACRSSGRTCAVPTRVGVFSLQVSRPFGPSGSAARATRVRDLLTATRRSCQCGCRQCSQRVCDPLQASLKCTYSGSDIWSKRVAMLVSASRVIGRNGSGDWSESVCGLVRVSAAGGGSGCADASNASLASQGDE